MTSYPEDIDPETLASEFEKLTEDIAAQASTVDVTQAMAAGRRSVRRRRALAGASGVAVFGLAALVAMPALAGGSTPVPVTSPGTVAESPSDPLTTRAEFGWLPTPLSATSHTSDLLDGIFTTTAYNPNQIRASGLNTSATLYTWSRNAANPDPHTSVPGQAVVESQIGTLNGHPVERYVTTENGGLTGNAVNGGIQAPAKCETFYTPGVSLAQAGITAFGEVSVVWRTPSGDWADIDYSYVNQAAPGAADLVHMARTVTFEEAALKMPFQVTLPDDLQLQYAQQGKYQAVAPHDNILQFLQDSVAVEIAVDAPASVVLQCAAKPTDPDLYATREINGLDYTVYIYREADGPTASLTAFGTATEILDHITSYGPDPANWTTHVIQH